MMKDHRPAYLKKEDPKFILFEDRSLIPQYKQFILAHLIGGGSIKVFAENGGILFEDCAILLKECTRHNIEAWNFPEVEFFMIPSGHVMYEGYLDDDITEIDYFFDPYDVFLEDMEQIMIKNGWNSDKIKEILEQIKEQMRLSEMPYNPDEYHFTPENFPEKFQENKNDESWTLETPEE